MAPTVVEQQAAPAVASGTTLEPRTALAGAQVSRRRRLGAYYTPREVATTMARWALGDGTGPLLDPSYGGCVFLDAAALVLAERGTEGPYQQLYGVDIDDACADAVESDERLVDANFTTKDFLKTSPAELSRAPFAAIVGNPPYVRHHWMTEEQRETARLVAAVSQTGLPATASLWAYFLLHSLEYLAVNGRLAMLVPEAILQADYAAPLRKTLRRRFASTWLIHIRERLFEGTDEAVVLVACSGFGRCGELKEAAVDSVEELEPVLSGSNAGSCEVKAAPVRGRRVDPATLALLCRLEESSKLRCISEIATVRVGIVTGANGHFIRSRRDLDDLGVPEPSRYPIVARTRWLRGLALDDDDHERLAENEGRAFLVRPRKNGGIVEVKQWIEEGKRNGVQKRYKCALRDAWFQIELPDPPDAFATCARMGPPMLVLNRGDLHCTNTLHWIGWKDDLPVEPEAVAVGFLTSAVGLWAELYGRRYGGGVLKVEPGTLNSIPVPLVPGVEGAFEPIHHLLRAGREEEARSLADKHVLCSGLGLSAADIDTLQKRRRELMKWRRPFRTRSPVSESHQNV